jgi:hypothetical protein
VSSGPEGAGSAVPILAKVGAAFFAAWGLLHVVGGGAMLMAAGQGADAYLAMVATALPPELRGSASGPAVPAVLAYHAFNLVWIGGVVTVVALALVRKNDRVGFAVAAALVTLTDLGLVVFHLGPGVMTWGTAIPGIGLWALAMVTAGPAALRGSR